MLKIHKYEAVGIGVSIGIMALALFLMRLDGASENSQFDTSSQSASVIESQNGVEGASAAIQSSIGAGGKVEKLVITDVVFGDEDKVVKEGDTVEVNYIGTLQNGQEFDNSYKKGESFTFKVGDRKVIDGWNQGIVGMRAGGQRIIIVPSHMAYGKEGYGPIPGNATLVFAIELLEIK